MSWMTRVRRAGLLGLAGTMMLAGPAVVVAQSEPNDSQIQADVMKAMDGHILAKAVLEGRFHRP